MRFSTGRIILASGQPLEASGIAPNIIVPDALETYAPFDPGIDPNRAGGFACPTRPGGVTPNRDRVLNRDYGQCRSRSVPRTVRSCQATSGTQPPCIAGRGKLTDRLNVFPHGRDGRRQMMRTLDEVAAMQRLHGLGWGTRRIAAEVGCNRETVQRYLASGAWVPCRVPTWPSLLVGQAAWLTERLRRHRATRTWCARNWRPSLAS